MDGGWTGGGISVLPYDSEHYGRSGLILLVIAPFGKLAMCCETKAEHVIQPS